MQDVLGYVEYFENDLLSALRRHLEAAIDADRLTYEESATIYDRYEAGLHGYTYLTRNRKTADAPQPLPTHDA